MGTFWDSDDRPEDYERYKIERPPTIGSILAYGLLFVAIVAMVIIVCFFTGP